MIIQVGNNGTKSAAKKEQLLYSPTLCRFSKTYNGKSPLNVSTYDGTTLTLFVLAQINI
jgi:hypothetical protein